MAASKEGLIDNINCKLTAGGLTDIQASQLAGAAQALCCSSFYAVPCEACLPNAALNKGRFVYVQDAQRYRYSNGVNWVNNYSSSRVENLYLWGDNSCGQLGTGTTTSSLTPVSILRSTPEAWSEVGAGNYFSAGIKQNGTLWTWGSGANGRLGSGNTSCRSSPGTTAGGGTTWRTISVGQCTTGAIKTDGTLWTWGTGIYGSLGDGTTTDRSSPVTTAGGGTNWCQVSMYDPNGAGIKTDGTLWTWGQNTCGQLGDGGPFGRSSPGTVAGGGNNWCRVAVASNYMVALKTDGTLWTWGRNGYGQLGDGTTTNRSSPGTLAGGGTTWCAISGEFYYTGAIKTDGTLWTWGKADLGQIGYGSTNRSSPGTTSGGGTNWCSLFAGGSGFVAIKTDGTLWTWGYNRCGKLGNGTTTNAFSPIKLSSGNCWLKASMSTVHTMAVTNCSSGF